MRNSRVFSVLNHCAFEKFSLILNIFSDVYDAGIANNFIFNSVACVKYSALEL
jgi:hypothetical protein